MDSGAAVPDTLTGPSDSLVNGLASFVANPFSPEPPQFVDAPENRSEESSGVESQTVPLVDPDCLPPYAQRFTRHISCGES